MVGYISAHAVTGSRKQEHFIGEGQSLHIAVSYQCIAGQLDVAKLFIYIKNSGNTPLIQSDINSDRLLEAEFSRSR